MSVKIQFLGPIFNGVNPKLLTPYFKPVTNKMIATAKLKSPEDTTEFKDSIKVILDDTSNSLDLYFVNTAKHSKYVEYGRSPNRRRPPTTALIGWVNRNLGLYGKAAVRAAFLVARKIADRGIKPTLVMNSTFKLYKNEIKDTFRNAIVKEMNK